MAVGANVMQLVRLLDDEGFGALAGELLTEISLGREMDVGLNGELAKDTLIKFLSTRVRNVF